MSKGPAGHALLSPLRTAARFMAVAGAAGSLWLMLRAGHNNGRIVPLVILFAMWVLSPFLALVWADGSSRRWPTGRRVTLHLTMLIVSLGSLAVYGFNAVHPLSTKGAFIFLVVPAAAWALTAAGLAVSGMLASSRPPSDEAD